MRTRTCIILLAALLHAATFTACQDDTQEIILPPAPDNTVPVEIELTYEDEEDGYGIDNDRTPRSASTTEKNQNTGLDAELIPEVKSRSTEVKPDKLYGLHIRQLNSSGASLVSNANYSETANLGTKLTLSLVENTECQIVIIARGASSTPAIDRNSNWATLQGYKSEADIKSIDGTDQANLKNMPYILHLEKVKVVQKNGKYVIQNVDGTDARLRLKRLPAQLTVKWKFSVSGYDLEEVRLCQIPKDFYYFPESESSDWTTNSYPTLVKEYIDYFRLKGSDLTATGGKVTTDAEGYSNYTTWLPANVKGSAPQATAPEYRNKDIAPTGAGYLEFVAIKKADNKIVERIFYRVYLGGKETTDFNILENTNYVWKVNINGADYNRDPRIERQETTPVPANDDNFKPTSNCFMIQPSSSFSFNPYKHEAGTDGWNDQLMDSSTKIKSGQQIKEMKVYWQSKDAGTIGNLVMGYRLSTDDYSNQVRIADYTTPENARVYVRVPYSKGGNAVIAGYNETGDIVWSWHLWITDYVPGRINQEIGYDDYIPAQKRSLKGTVHKYLSSLWRKGGMYENMVMMDRDLGARSGGFPGISKGNNYTTKDAVDTQGLLYQWGRKDPFFGSPDGTTNEINVIFDGDGIAKKVTNVNRSNGTDQLENGNRLNYTVKNPLNFISYWNTTSNSDWWDTTPGGTGKDRWNKNNAAAPGKKSLYDPSPYGWKIPIKGSVKYTPVGSMRNYFAESIYDGFQDVQGSGKWVWEASEGAYQLNSSSSYFKYGAYCYQGTFYWKNEYSSAPGDGNHNPKGGKIFLLEEGVTPDTKDKWTIYNSVWFPTSAERHPREQGKLQNPSIAHLWTADYDCNLFSIHPKIITLGIYGCTYGWPVRCIQDTDVP